MIAKMSLLGGAALLAVTSLGGCATKKYVDQEVLRVESVAQENTSRIGQQEARIGQQESKLAGHDAHLAQLDQTSREALERATAAGKLAEGKFLYSMVLSDDSVKFPVDRAQLSPQAQARLGELAQRLKGENRNVYLEVQGHTDATGDEKYNERLGEERAEAVRKFLNKNGVALNRIGTISYGEEAPVAPNNTRDGRAQNRRVVVVVLS